MFSQNEFVVFNLPDGRKQGIRKDDIISFEQPTDEALNGTTIVHLKAGGPLSVQGSVEECVSMSSASRQFMPHFAQQFRQAQQVQSKVS